MLAPPAPRRPISIPPPLRGGIAKGPEAHNNRRPASLCRELQQVSRSRLLEPWLELPLLDLLKSKQGAVRLKAFRSGLCCLDRLEASVLLLLLLLAAAAAAAAGGLALGPRWRRRSSRRSMASSSKR